MKHSLASTILGLVFGLFGTTAYGQDFSIPSTWRTPTTSISRGVMEGIAQSVVNTLVPLFNTSGVIPDMAFDQPAYTIAAISRTDYLSGNTTYKQLVLNSMKTVFTLNPKISTDHNSEVVMWGLAAASAYRAYNDSTSLGYTQSMWDQVSPFQIQPSDAATGFASAVNAFIPSVCNGLTVAGGVFAYPINSTFPYERNTTDVDGETVAAFVALSGHLFEFTGDSMYLDAATAGARFIQNHMHESSIITGTITVGTCTILNLPYDSYISGFTIWGLSILATHDTTWTSFMNDLILSSVPYYGWTNATNGIIYEGSSDPTTPNVETCLRVIWIRGLHEAWTRMDPTSAVANYIQSYLYVQFNALRDLAYNPDMDAYSPIWQGPPVSKLLSWGQLDALDVLNSAFAMVQIPKNDNTTSLSDGSNVHPTSSSVPGSISMSAAATANTISSLSKSSSLSKIPIIVGAIVGSLATITVGGLVTFVLARLRARRAKETTYDPATYSPYVVEPYLEPSVPSPAVVPSNKARKDNTTTFSTTSASAPPPNIRTDARSPTSQLELVDPFLDRVHPTSTTDIVAHGASRPGDPTLSQMIATLTSYLASIPMTVQVNLPPPRYAENDIQGRQ